MNRFNQSIQLFSLFFIGFLLVTTQVNAFDVESYKQFLKSNENLTADELLAQYPADRFFEKARQVEFEDALNSALIDSHYNLTQAEKSLLEEHGFVVTERLSYTSFGEAFAEIYHNDLPVYVSTDALLHALHMSYDSILINVEHSLLIPKLSQLLTTLHAQIPKLSEHYALEPKLLPMLKDFDVYLTVPLVLLEQQISPVYPENQEVVDALLAAIQAEQPKFFELFSSTPREIDFSQFTPRGHYTETFGFRGQSLMQYFQAMIWLGRTEIYLSAPKQGNPSLQQKEEDIQRQTILAALIAEAAETAGVYDMISDIDSTLRFLVGESDNVTLFHIRDLMDETDLQDATELLEVQVWKDFQATLLAKEYAPQRILSQILLSPMGPEQIEPASAFLLLGQRFAIDSFVTGNVVYDKIIFNGAKITRMLPSTLDVLFALGNDAAAQLLEAELRQYHYAPNLAALRYLLDSYQLETWDDTLYSGWLNAIRTLNPPLERGMYPSFMQTAAWWQEKMNTQLAAWAQLRHDNLLYVKQSYTGQTICSFPESFVEPVPEFYEALQRLASNAIQHFQTVKFEEVWGRNQIINYFKHMSEVADTLAEIARKELAQTSLLPDEKDFLKRMLYDSGFGSGPRYDGWYPKLFIAGENDGLMKQDYVVADIHTSPTDEAGSRVGWVVHAGTGPINLAVVICDTNPDQPHAFIGPVMSYYERITVNFKRLTDEEWQTEYATTPSYRPPFVNLYLANQSGEVRGESISLFTRTGSPPTDVQPHGKLILPLGQVKRTALLQNYPNPFNPETWMPYTLAADAKTTITIYNIKGQHIRTLNLGHQHAGSYLTKDKAVFWDGRNQQGNLVSSGVYFYQLQVENSDDTKDFSGTKKMIIVK